ncbi:MAG: acyl carrier protein [Hyphomicrobiaceae bacterium]|nr:acyl carrier protein [Hyphomicrobiaceae bacterium]
MSTNPQDQQASVMTGIDRTAIETQIIDFIRAEIQNKSAVLTMATRRDEVEIDSIDIVQVIFNLEEKYGIEVNLSPNTQFETVGELVDALIAFIPEEKLPRS